MTPIPPQVMLFAAKYGLKILAALAIIAALAYTYHKIDQGGYDRATAMYEARDAKDAIKAADILAAAQKSVADKTLEHERILTGVLIQNDEDKKNLIAERDAAVARSVYVTTKANADRGNAVPGKAGVLKSDDTGGQGTCNQELAEDNQRKLVYAEYQIARLADLHLSCVEQIERTHTLK